MDTPIFHLFHRLPAELRITTWDLAIHPPTPGVNLFTADMSTWRHPANQRKQIPGRTLTLPDPTTSNPSTYLLDHALWTACFESRARLIRAFRNKPFATYNFPSPNPEISPDPDISPSPQLLTVLPSQDLFIFQMPNTQRKKTLWFSFIHRWGDYGIYNGALVFDPAWTLPARRPAKPELQPWVQIANTMTLRTDVKALKRLWFVDYSLKRDNEVPLEEGNRWVFTGVGCRFVGVCVEDVGAVGKPWRCEGNFADRECWRFVNELAKYRSWVEDEVKDRLRLNPNEKGLRLPSDVRYGILACEYF
ncbi:hypothetical protein B0T14DRAFT_579741 [Immersiella caudata]|uniref:2EXR domain-containing protein n=1 Tax=Immersiella caudata TaxID=314043 RepID=A0AA39X5D5_9PEZI|nr:hypothetical protein B0T14DRAFT_579741 [Immersiella caudata]